MIILQKRELGLRAEGRRRSKGCRSGIQTHDWKGPGVKAGFQGSQEEDRWLRAETAAPPPNPQHGNGVRSKAGRGQPLGWKQGSPCCGVRCCWRGREMDRPSEARGVYCTVAGARAAHGDLLTLSLTQHGCKQQHPGWEEGAADGVEANGRRPFCFCGRPLEPPMAYYPDPLPSSLPSAATCPLIRTSLTSTLYHHLLQSFPPSSRWDPRPRVVPR